MDGYDENALYESSDCYIKTIFQQITSDSVQIQVFWTIDNYNVSNCLEECIAIRLSYVNDYAGSEY